MRNRIAKEVLVLCVLLVSIVPAWAQMGPGRGRQRAAGQGMCLARIDSFPRQALDAQEAAGLAYLREEEKLAHDLYTRLHSKWGLRVFGNISQSEQHHFSVIKLLLDRYELPDPAANRQAGDFQDASLKTLYQDLTKQGDLSLNSALRAGATIEDLNIHDLEKAAAATDNEDLKFVYQNLRRASENHMRAFARQLEAAGESYKPQYISSEAFSEIVSQQTRMGRGFGARGNGQRGSGRGNNGICPWINR